MKNRQYVTVTQLTKYIKDLFDNNQRLNNIIVRGEISNFKQHSSGHMYFTLKDDNASIRAVMFRSNASRVPFVPENGMRVYVGGQVSIYEAQGAYQLYVEKMEPDGIGALHLAFEQLKGKLGQEGLFEDKHKKILPMLPKRVGVVTSPTGAALRDILHVLKRRYPNLHIIIIPVSVQGEAAPPEIAEAIRRANEFGDIDVLIVGRGGGSIEELWAFNTEVVARAIFASQIPIISAVGHETDYTIADFVADRRAPTPSAAAEVVVPELEYLTRLISNYQSRLNQGLLTKHQSAKARLERCMSSPWFVKPKDCLSSYRQATDNLKKELRTVFNNVQQQRFATFRELIAQLQALSPLATLNRGYSLVLKQGQVVSNARQCNVGDQVNVKLGMGDLVCNVMEVECKHGEKR